MTLPKALTPGEAAARAGLSVSALHFYEREGLIRSWRTEGNQRRYDRATLRRLGIIKAAQAIGISLKEVKEKLAPLPHDRAAKKADWARVATDWQGDLDARITRLQRLRDYLEGCIGCGCLSMDHCPLYNPEDKLRAEGPGPRTIEENL
ncbi:redox-sensitive transcriptional activator SoxR [Parvularcula lutaonensis]|uniref:Redox-sensitive transcriptional activator SoxR n=1 Tax=Parvularcula lutaonensis TaxID=491923 RepID=A0ABV7MCJ4_9PROT|nr:redox-sensitive transcriptional activator SoxR [Parvularcula lutaonensis]GGY50964.1 redox-sensitive transcriptional activator SoxR [Parvularcula lutaonensis]